MYAITVRQPFATLFTSGPQKSMAVGFDVQHRGRLAVYAARSVDWPAVDNWKEMMPELFRGRIAAAAIVALVDVVDCTARPDHTWDLHRADEVQLLTHPVACGGDVGIWKVPDYTADLVGMQLSALAIQEWDANRTPEKGRSWKRRKRRSIRG